MLTGGTTDNERRPDMADQESVLSELLKRPRRRTSIKMAADPNQAARLAELRDELGELKQTIRRDAGWTDKIAEKTAEVDEFVDTIEVWEFIFESVGSQAIEQLEAKHPPTAKQQAEHRAENGNDTRLTTNPETFPQVLLAATMTGIVKPGESEISPPLTFDEIKVLFASEAWTQNDKVRMFWRAREADATTTQMLIGDLGNG